MRVWYLEVKKDFHSGGVVEDDESSSQFWRVSAIQGSWILVLKKHKPFKNVVVLCLIFRIMFFSLSLFDPVDLWGCSWPRQVSVWSYVSENSLHFRALRRNSFRQQDCSVPGFLEGSGIILVLWRFFSSGKHALTVLCISEDSCTQKFANTWIFFRF